KLLGKIVGVMCPPLFGCRTNTELCRVRGWDKNLPSHLLGALPKRSWLKRLRRLGLEVLIPLWRHAASKSEATRSRWHWTWVGDDSVFKKYGEQLGVAGVIGGFFTVVEVATIITLWPWYERLSNSWKINGRIRAYYVGFLATLITAATEKSLTPIKFI